MFNLFKKKSDEFSPTKKMVEAAILKGQRIGLKRHEIIEMASMMEKDLSRNKIEKIVDKVLSTKTLS